MNSETTMITGFVTIAVALIGVFGNWYLSIRNKEKDIEQREYQFVLENLKESWVYQNQLYSETLKVASVLVLNDETGADEFKTAYKRFWELYWSDLPTFESKDVENAMVDLKKLIDKKIHPQSSNEESIKKQKSDLERALLDLSKAIRRSSLLLTYSDLLKKKLDKELIKQNSKEKVATTTGTQCAGE